MKPNPIIVLPISPKSLSEILGLPIAEVQHYFNQDQITDKDHSKVRGISLIMWGDIDNAKQRATVWERIYPGTRPNIYQVLHYRMNISVERLAKYSGLKERLIIKNLTRTKIPQGQLQAIGRYAANLAEELSSHKRRAGRDPRCVEINLALRDKTRIREFNSFED